MHPCSPKSSAGALFLVALIDCLTGDPVYAVACSPTQPGLVSTGGGDDKAFIWKIGQADSPLELKGKEYLFAEACGSLHSAGFPEVHTLVVCGLLLAQGIQIQLPLLPSVQMVFTLLLAGWMGL